MTIGMPSLRATSPHTNASDSPMAMVEMSACSMIHGRSSGRSRASARQQPSSRRMRGPAMISYWTVWIDIRDAPA